MCQRMGYIIIYRPRYFLHVLAGNSPCWTSIEAFYGIRRNPQSTKITCSQINWMCSLAPCLSGRCGSVCAPAGWVVADSRIGWSCVSTSKAKFILYNHNYYMLLYCTNLQRTGTCPRVIGEFIPYSDELVNMVIKQSQTGINNIKQQEISNRSPELCGPVSHHASFRTWDARGGQITTATS